MKNTIICIILALSLLIFSSCALITFPSDKKEKAPADTSAQTGLVLPEGQKRAPKNTETKKAQAQALLDKISSAPLGKDTYTVAVYDGFSFAPDYAIDSYELALIERNEMVEKKFGITLKELDTPLELMLDDSYNSFLSGSDYADMLVIPAGMLGTFAEKGHLLNVYSLPGMSFDGEYFDASVIEQMTGGTRAYAISGAFTRDIGAYHCIYVNTDLLAKTGLADPAPFVKNGTWTWAKLNEYIAAFMAADGENYTTASDSVRDLTATVYKSAGLDFMNTGFNKTPTVAFDDVRTDEVTSVLRTLYWSRPYYMWQGQPSAADVFASGKALFAVGTVAQMADFARLGRGWTVLPVPKTDGAQEDYISYLSADTPVMVVPANTADPENLPRLIRALFAASYSFPDDGYYDYLTATAANNSKTLEMLDYVCGIRAGVGRIDFVDLYAERYPDLLPDTVDTVTELAENPSKDRTAAAKASQGHLNWRMTVGFPTVN